MILDGKKVRDELLDTYKKQIEEENLDLLLAIILVGNDPASQLYINNKEKYASKIGIKTKLIHLEENASEEEVINIIEELNNDESVTGIILQSPVPNHINIENCISQINPSKDIDGFTKESFYSLAHNIDGLRPCTPKGIIRLLEYYNIPLEGKDVCIIGRGNIVGKPLLFEFLNKNATVTMCHSKTKDIKQKTLKADIVVACCGKKHILTSDMVKGGAIVIDTGITMEDGKIIGDADFDQLIDICSYITPNPGGVGPMTVAMIMENVILAGRRK